MDTQRIFALFEGESSGWMIVVFCRFGLFEGRGLLGFFKHDRIILWKGKTTNGEEPMEDKKNRAID
jgi:hypothetical protein